MTNDRDKTVPGPVRSAVAGRLEDATRSDCRVVVEPSASNEVAVDSKVSAYFGASIRELALEMLAAFGAQGVRLSIEDRGALPFVLAARIETALRRAGLDGTGIVPGRVPPPPGTDTDRVRRSRLYLPGNEPKFMINAGLHRPDAVILDLEDSVHPDEKDAARSLVRNALAGVDFMGAERMVRINQHELGLDDLRAVVPEAPDLILIPKTERAEDVVRVEREIEEIQGSLSGRHPIWLMPILESALGIENAFDIATASPSVVALTIGLEDYTADLGVLKTREGSESLYARMRLVNAARAAGIQAIDSVYGDVADPTGLAEWAARSSAMGFEGMGCIHPRQIEPIHHAFAPSAEELEKALKVVAAFAEAQAKGLSVVSLGSRMIDPPVVLRAQRLVDQARKLGSLESGS